MFHAVQKHNYYNNNVKNVCIVFDGTNNVVFWILENDQRKGKSYIFLNSPNSRWQRLRERKLCVTIASRRHRKPRKTHTTSTSYVMFFLCAIQLQYESHRTKQNATAYRFVWFPLETRGHDESIRAASNAKVVRSSPEQRIPQNNIS